MAEHQNHAAERGEILFDHGNDSDLFASGSETETSRVGHELGGEQVTCRSISTASTAASSDGGGTSAQAGTMRLLWGLEEMCKCDSPDNSRLITLLLSANVFHEKSHSETCVEEDQGWLTEYYDLPDDDDVGLHTHPWDLRLEFSADQMKHVGIEVCSIRQMLLANTGRRLHIVYSDLPSSSRSQFLRIRTRAVATGYEPRAFLLLLLLHAVELPLHSCSATEPPCFKKAKVSSQSEGNAFANDPLPSTSVNSLKKLRLEYDELRRGQEDHIHELCSFRARTMEILASATNASPQADNTYNAILPQTVLTSTENDAGHGAMKQDIEKLVHKSASDLLEWTDEIVQKMCDSPSQQRLQHRLVGRHVKNEWMRRFAIAELNSCIIALDNSMCDGLTLEN